MSLTKENFFEHMTPEPNTGCWLWTGHYNNLGRGHIYDPRVKNQRFAYRISYELHIGPIPNQLRVLHKCDTGACVNPDHLFLGTAKENTQDMIKKGRAAYQGRTHCKRGHPLSGDNLATLRTRNERVCRICQKMRDHKSKSKRRHKGNA